MTKKRVSTFDLVTGKEIFGYIIDVKRGGELFVIHLDDGRKVLRHRDRLKEISE